MRLKVICCDVLAREVYYCAATAPHVVDIALLKRGLHNTRDLLRAELQRAINLAPKHAYDAVCLGYALCGNAIAGLSAGDVPLVVPRGHDCITLYLGSRALYQQEFTAHPGTYYYTLDYVERREADTGSAVPLGTASDAARQSVYEEYVRQYGKDNADYLLEVTGGWITHYSRAAFIDTGVGDVAAAKELVRREAQGHGWTFAELAGNLVLLRKLLHGEWDDNFLVVSPGGQISVTYDEDVIARCPAMV